MGSEMCIRDRVNPVKYDTWLKSQRADAVSWKTLKPSNMTASIGWLELLEDQSIFANGDTQKHDAYELEFTDLPDGITTLRLEALPDKRLPKGGPGRAPVGAYAPDAASHSGKQRIYARSGDARAAQGRTARPARDAPAAAARMPRTPRSSPSPRPSRRTRPSPTSRSASPRRRPTRRRRRRAPRTRSRGGSSDS